MNNSLSIGIWNLELGILKNILKLMEFKFGGRESDQYKYVKEQVMNFIFDGTKRFFQEGTAVGLFERCPCGANLRKGWDKCEDCAGSGYRDKVKEK